jgi:pimeloyl-ACP methyl ester carboxylesterase
VETPDSITLSTIVEGELGHPTLLVHDLNASLHDWETLLPALVVSGHVVYACDLLGHGQSPHPADPRQYYAQMHVTAFRRWVDGLNLVRAPILIGHGFGAYLCLRYALGHPYKVFRLVLINPLLTPEQIAPLVLQFDRHPWIERLCACFAPDWTHRQVYGLTKGGPAELETWVLKEAGRTSPFNRQILPTVADLTIEMLALPTRSLFLWGEADPLLDMSLIPTLVEDLSEIKTVPMPGIGHRPHLEAPEATNRAIINFLHGIEDPL